MKLKLDENLGHHEAEVLREAGRDVATVFEQKATSASDLDLIALCSAEERCLVTLDMEFGNPFLFKPSQYRGIALLTWLPPWAQEVGGSNPLAPIK